MESEGRMIPRIGAIPLLAEKGYSQPGGAAFLLASRPTKGALFVLDRGEIEIREGCPYVVTRFGSASDGTSAFSMGHTLTQQGLDMMSILGFHDAVIRDAEDEHLIWWTDAPGLVLRAVSTTLLRFTIGAVTLTVRDKEGNVVSPILSPPRHHIAFRFFRLAQTTDDLFDAYRNMYLAFEALLSTKHPKPAGEREIDWLRRALRSASPSLRLDTLGLPVSPDLVEVVLEKVYRDARLPLFHAKEGHPYIAPQDTPADRQAIAGALALLTQIVLRMAEAWFDTRRPGGGVFFGWVYENVQRMVADCSAYASSYEAAFDATETDLSHPRFATAARLECRLAPELQRGREPAVLSVATGTELQKASPLRRVELASASTPFIAHVFEAPIELAGVGQFEDLMHIRGMNSNQPRSLFRQ
jgi:hypothetical protein